MGKDKPKEEKKQCQSCDGTGAYYSETLDVLISCPWCNGTGQR